jgi:hypothetical protein
MIFPWLSDKLNLSPSKVVKLKFGALPHSFKFLFSTHPINDIKMIIMKNKIWYFLIILIILIGSTSLILFNKQTI